MAVSKMFARFASDETKEEQGVWVSFGDGIEVRVRRLKSKKSQEVRKDLERPLADQIRRGPLPDAVAEDLLLKQIAQGIISDWRGVDDDNGVEIPYSGKAAYDVLKAYPEFRDQIFQVSVDTEAYRARVDEEAEKNS